MDDVTTDFVELRGEVPAEIVAIIDAVAQATPGANRMTVVRQILREWAAKEVHRATLVQRLARGHGSAAEAERKGGS